MNKFNKSISIDIFAYDKENAASNITDKDITLSSSIEDMMRSLINKIAETESYN
jgi:hypothetical protein